MYIYIYTHTACYVVTPKIYFDAKETLNETPLRPKDIGSGPWAQRTQCPLIKEYTLNHHIKAPLI